MPDAPRVAIRGVAEPRERSELTVCIGCNLCTPSVNRAELIESSGQTVLESVRNEGVGGGAQRCAS